MWGPDDYEKLYRQALKLWGERFQFLMVLEECSELSKEVLRYLRTGYSINRLIEEGVDVEIMIQQLKIIIEELGVDPSTWRIEREHKLERLDRMIKKEKREGLRSLIK